MRQGAHHAENLPRPRALAASGGGSGNKEKILSPEWCPLVENGSEITNVQSLSVACAAN
jgi:hypothetical protein